MHYENIQLENGLVICYITILANHHYHHLRAETNAVDETNKQTLS